MSFFRTRAILGLAWILAIVPGVQAQQAAPRIGYVAPAGAQQGASLLVTVGGRYLDGTTRAFVSGSGVQAKVIECFKPIRQGQAAGLTTRLQKLMEKKAAAGEQSSEKPDDNQRPKTAKAQWTPEEEMLLTALKKKLAFAMRAPPVPATGETAMLQVTLSADAAPGRREIRLETPRGLTNPMVFCVGELPEILKEANVSELSSAAKDRPRRSGELRAAPAEPPMNITLPTVVNGQIMPGGVDRFRFSAHKGQKLVIAAGARELIPYISDAVPGWFQAALTLYDAKGRELAHADHYLFHPDPVLYYEVPRDGDYTVEIRDSLYRGREDFVYRITLGEVPFVTSIFPLGGTAGKQTAVELRGWNLATTTFTQDAKGAEPGIYFLALGGEAQVSNPVLFGLDTLPECLEKDPHDRIENAQAVTLPIVVNGRIDSPDQTDVFRFEGRAGEEVVAEVHARRLGSPLDSMLRLTDATGRLLAYNDDHEDKSSGLNTHHADSFFRAALPADGTYYLHLGDVQHKGGPEYAYRLRISLPRPDFDLRIVPASISGRGGSNVPVTVYAVRKDGFTGEIALELKDAPEGFALSSTPPANPGPILVPANQDQVKLMLKVLPLSQEGPINLKVEGTAAIAGRKVSRVAVPAEDMVQAFEYRHLVPAQELKVAVSGRYTPPKPVAKLLSKTPIKIPAGGTARLQLSLSPRSLIGQLKFELRKPPAGIALETTSPSRDSVELVLHADADKVKPGQRGNLTLTAVAEKPAAADKPVVAEKSTEPDKAKPAKDAQRTPLPNFPTIPFEIVKP